MLKIKKNNFNEIINPNLHLNNYIFPLYLYHL